MKKPMTQSLIATVAAAILLTGCGSGGFSPAVPASHGAGPAQALSTRTLEAGFKHIHMAIFTKMDVNQDKQVDEYEAGQMLDLRDFERADRNRNGRLTRKEFMDYAIGDGVFGFFRQDKHKFMRQAREALLKAFRKLDKNRDHLLDREEMTNEALKKVGVNLTIDGLRLRVEITEFDYELYELADKTKDQSLSQAEYEDYCVNAFIRGINPDYNTNPNPTPEDPGSGEADGWY